MIDWERLAVETGSILPDGTSGVNSTGQAMQALELIVGEENIRDAVERAVTFAPSGWSAASVLRHIRSLQAIEMAYAIYKTRPYDEAPGAVWLIKEIGHPRALDWVAEFLADEQAASAGVDIVDQLLYRRAVEPTDERVARLLALMEAHPSETVRAKAATIRDDVARRHQDMVAWLVGRHQRHLRRRGGERARPARRVARLADRLEAEAPECAAEIGRLSPELAMHLADELQRRGQERAAVPPAGPAETHPATE